MKFTVQQIADVLEGTIKGDPNTEVNKLAKIEEGEMGGLSFLSNQKYKQFLYTTRASAVIVHKDIKLEQEVSCALIMVDDPYAAFTQLLTVYQEARNNKQGVESPSFIHESSVHGSSFYLGAFGYISNNVIMGDQVKVHPHVFIGDNVTIGDHVIIQTGVKIMPDSVIGSHVTIEAGSVIGSDGFGYAPQADGSYVKIPQIGNVIIEDYVNIGALTTIDRATLGSTVIKKGVKLDNQIQIGHNVEIGENTVIAAQTGIAGSTKIGKSARLGGQVGIAGHLKLGDNIGVQAQSGIGRNLKDNVNVQGSPAFDYNKWSRSYVVFKNLEKIEKRITDIEKKQS
jgi:UDP-3-O-[3-hydroxymyristoyl] glucosamine N-acyltransferase